MESLIKSGEPLLVLAGAIFAVGVAFDFIFSTEFKDKLRSSIVKTISLDDSRLELFSEYVNYFVTELLSYGRALPFVLKSIGLSSLFYIVSALLQSKYHSGSNMELMSLSILSYVGAFSYPVVILFVAHLLFDLLSAYLFIVYLRMIELVQRLRNIIIILVSNIIVTGIVWAVFFCMVFSLHVKIADIEFRSEKVGIKIDEDTITWTEDSIFVTNAQLSSAHSSILRVLEKPRAVEKFVAVGNNNILMVIADTKDLVTLAQRVTGITKALYPSNFELKSDPKLSGDLAVIDVDVRNAIGWREMSCIASSALDLLQPTRIILGRSGYFATSNAYVNCVDTLDEHVQWTEAEHVVQCGNAIKVLSYAELDKFDLSKCDGYLVTTKSSIRYFVLAVGAFFSPNYRVSYSAFFWSSVALNVSFYLCFFLLIIARILRDQFAIQVAHNVFNLRHAFFAPLLGLISVGLLILFTVKAATRMMYEVFALLFG